MNKDKIIQYLNIDKIKLSNEDSNNLSIGVIVDIETTGLALNSEIIQISILVFKFDEATYKIHEIVGKYTSYNDVEVIPEEITKLTGISKDDVKDHKINWNKVKKIFDKASVIIAHSAKFDRPILENNYPPLKDIKAIWLCSAFDPSYSDHFITSIILDYVLFRLGFWFDHHSAEEDVLAVLLILTSNFPETDINIFTNIVNNALSTSYTVEVYDTDFNEKEILKSEKYRWNPKNKCWWIKSTDVEKTQSWLKDKLTRFRVNLIVENIEDRFRN